MSLKAMIALVDELRALERRADKYRGRKGRLDISREMLDRLAELAGREVSIEQLSDGRLRVTFAEFVAVVDEAIASLT